MQEVQVTIAEDHLELASKAIQEGFDFYAIAVLENILKRFPDFVKARGLLYRAKRKGFSVKPIFWRLGRKVVGCCVLSSCCFVRKNRLDKLLKIIEFALAIDPSNTFAWRALVRVTKQLDLRESNIIAWEQLCEVLPETKDYPIGLGMACLSIGNAQRAIEIGESLLKDNPMNGDAVTLIQEASLHMSVFKDQLV